MVTIPDYRQQYVDLNVRDRLSVADAVVLEHHQGLTKATIFISAVDPWSYPHDDTPASLNVKSYVKRKCRCSGNACRKKVAKLHRYEHIKFSPFSAPHKEGR